MTTEANLAAMLQERIGLDIDSIGRSSLDRAILARLADRKVASAADYYQLVRDSETEFQRLVETLIVPETWFFRNRAAFAALGDFATAWREAGKGGLRCLSAPCSSGEEPYSIAMRLLDSGLGAEQFHIDAFDISAVAIEKAKLGEYTQNSFRGDALEFRKRYFSRRGRLWQIDPKVLKSVAFDRANLLEEGMLGAKQPYHVIFCRNLLIYLDETARQKMIDLVVGSLAPGGLLFVGSGEKYLLRDAAITSFVYPGAFALTKIGGETVRSTESETKWSPRELVLPGRGRPSKGQPVPNRPPSRRAKAAPSVASAPDKSAAVASETSVAADEMTLLDQLRRHADAGELDLAAQMGEAYLHAGGANAEAYYLLGLVCDSRRDAAGAERYYRNAIYLNPGHAAALAQLALIVARGGDEAGARVLRARAKRRQALVAAEEKE